MTLSSQEELLVLWETHAVSAHKESAPLGAEYLQSPELWVWETKDGQDQAAREAKLRLT